jgi:RimJ/RimL family protein N-acetyltransferase
MPRSRASQRVRLILKIRRLELRPFRGEDIEALASYSTTEDFIRFSPCRSRQGIVQPRWFDCRGRPAGVEKRLALAIQARDVPTLIGTIRIGVREPEHHQGDVGYAMHHAHRRKGYATEALDRVLAFAFEELSLERIWATADVRNLASWRTMEKVGMVREGIMRRHRLVRGAWCDSVLYGKIGA